MRFEGQTVLISGAASGFGRLAAQRFAGEGARLSLCDRDGDGLAAAVATLDGAEVVSLQIDVSDEADQKRHVDETLARYGRIDVALNNAGIFTELKRIPDTTLDEFERIMAVNARGVFLALKYQLPAMAAQGGGAIINTASVAGITGTGYCAAYAASKHAVVGLTKSAADEYSRHGVRINAVCPAFAKTPMLHGVTDALGARHGEDRSAAEDRLSGRIPMGRVGEAEEVVAAMMFLADPANSFMTGQAVAVDGGLTAI